MQNRVERRTAQCFPLCPLKTPPLNNPFTSKPLFSRVCRTSLLKTLGKVEFACNEQFLLFSLCSLPLYRIFHPFHQI